MHYETATGTPSSLGSCGFVPHASLPLSSLPAHRTSASFNAWVLDIHRKQHALNWHIRVPSERTPHSTVCSYVSVTCANKADSLFVCECVSFQALCAIPSCSCCPQAVADAQPKCAPASKDISHSPRSRLRRSLSTYSLTSVFVQSGRQSTPVTTPVVSDYSQLLSANHIVGCRFLAKCST